MSNQKIPLKRTENPFSYNPLSSLYVLADHIILEGETISIQPYYAHGNLPSIKYSELFTNNPNRLYIANQFRFLRNDPLLQIDLIYKDEDNNDFELLSDLTAVFSNTPYYQNSVNCNNTIVKYFSQFTNAQYFEFIGWEVTFKI